MRTKSMCPPLNLGLAGYESEIPSNWQEDSDGMTSGKYEKFVIGVI